MRRARITYEGAFHHAMNRGIRGEEIFTGSRCKTQFLDYLKEKSAKFHIRIFAYCIMNSHYHLVLENSSGKMSEFLKQVNGEYGMYYRKHSGGKGYVFQSRFKSTLIQDEAYLQTSIAYTLLNPVRAGMVKQPEDYIWSSYNDYFSSRNSGIVDTLFVEELFGSRPEFLHFIQLQSGKDIIERKTRYGCILGGDEFLKEALKKYDRRKRQEGLHGKRINDRYFEPVEKVIWEFERQKEISIEDIQPHTIIGKRLRAELLVHLKDRAGLTYPEIIKFEIFDNLSLGSLASIYQNAKRRMK